MTGEATDLVALKRLARDAGGKVCWTAVETGRPEFRNVSHYIYDGPTMLAETNGDLPHIAAFMAATAPATILSLATLIEAQAAEIEAQPKWLDDGWEAGVAKLEPGVAKLISVPLGIIASEILAARRAFLASRTEKGDADA